MSNWTHVAGYFYWKGIRVSFNDVNVPFLALMLGDSKGLVRLIPKGDHYTLAAFYGGTILVFCVRFSDGWLETSWEVV